MTYSIRDWDGHDRAQYFTGAYVRVCRTGSPDVVAQVDGFDGDLAIMNDGMQRFTCDIDDIDWDGLSPRKCVCDGNYLFFIAPLGSRTTRKPVTRSNLGVVRISTAGRSLSNRELGSNVIGLYLGSNNLPGNMDEVHYRVCNNNLGVLSDKSGFTHSSDWRYEEDEDGDEIEVHTEKWVLYTDMIKVFETVSRNEFLSYLEDNWEDI